jgi:flagellar hook-associated protein 3 FlgL
LLPKKKIQPNLKLMRVSSASFSDSFIYQTNLLQEQQNVLQNEATTGLTFSSPGDDPAGMSQALELQADTSSNTQYQNNITQLQNTATTSDNALNGLQTIISQANTIAAGIDGTSSQSELAGDATEVSGLIQQALQLANTQDSNGNYVFGGTNTSSPPFVATTDSNGNVTGVSYQGNTSVAQTEIAPGVTVSAQTLGANTSGSGPRGLITDSRYGADLFNHLISLQNDLSSGNVSAVNSTDLQNLQKDENNIAYQVGSNGVTQSDLTNTGSVTTQQNTTLATQMSNLTSANLADTLTHLQQIQTSYQAALESGVQVMQISLLNYMY